MTKKKSTRYKLKKADWFIFVICPIFSLLTLGFYLKDIYSFSQKNGKSVATIYFKRNTAQRKFIDNDIWERINNKSPIYNGDKIRTSDNSEIYAEFENSGAKIQLMENSLVQIFYNDKEKAIEFLGGELLLFTGPKKEALTLVGMKRIAAAPNSKIKITVSKTEPTYNSVEEQAPKEAVVEVLEGEAKIDGVLEADINPAVYETIYNKSTEALNETFHAKLYKKVFGMANEAINEKFNVNLYQKAGEALDETLRDNLSQTAYEILRGTEGKTIAAIKASSKTVKAGEQAVVNVIEAQGSAEKETIENIKKAVAAAAKADTRTRTYERLVIEPPPKEEPPAKPKKAAPKKVAKKVPPKKKPAPAPKNDAAAKAEAERLEKLRMEEAERARAALAALEAADEQIAEAEEVVETISVNAPEEVVAPQKSDSVTFAKNVVNEKTGEFNYQYDVPLQDLFGKNKSIPAGAVIELNMAGVPKKPGLEFYAIFTNGTTTRKEANAHSPLIANNGQGFVAGERFDDTFRILLKDSIKNTKKAHLELRFDSKYYDEEPTIDNFELAGKVVTLDQNDLVTSFESNRESCFFLERVTLPKIPLTKLQSGFKLRVPLSKIFGQSKSIPQGSKLKFFVYADGPGYHFSNWHFYNCELDEWELILARSLIPQPHGQWHDLGTVKLKKAIENTDSSVFELVFLPIDMQKTVTLTNLEIRVTLVK